MKLFFSLLTINFLLLGFNDDVIEALSLVPGGQNIGIEIRPDGLLVSGSYDVAIEKGTYNPTRDSDIKVGDLIFEVENVHVSSLEEFIAQFKKYEGKKPDINVRLKRKNDILLRKLKIVKVGNKYKTGLFIKERLLGIGTISFYDPSTGMYGALGHEIIDNDTKNIVEVDSGIIYSSVVTGINKSEDGRPGAKVADIEMSDEIGVILANTPYGIYGKYENLPDDYQIMEMGDIEEVKLGDAEIWTVTHGDRIEKYKIKITNLESQSYIAPKGISFRVIDEELLKISNGIVGGMSGSPIIQQNKLIGAVTHVIVDDVDCGYGIYMQWMVETSYAVCCNFA